MKIICATPLNETYRKELSDITEDIQFMDKKDITAEDLKDTDAVLGNVNPDILNQSSSLKWVQLDSAGADKWCTLKDDIVLTNASGAYNTAISEHMLGCTLAVIKNLYRYKDQQEFHDWINLGPVRTISQLKILVIGMGEIGTAYGQLMHTLGAKVYGVRRTIHDKPDFVKKLYTTDTMQEILPYADIVALCLPETPDTYHIINEDTLAKMKEGSVLINVGRGNAVDENALIKAMKSHHLSAACLDVTEHEPLPKNNPLWECENVYITPHISGKFNAETTIDKIVSVYAENLRHFIKNEPLINIVDKKLRY